MTSSYALPILFVVALVLAGCADAPTPKSDTTTPPPRPAPPRPTEAPPRPQPAATEASNEGMTIYELQDRLTALGYKLGAVDGVIGPRTVEALKKFQGDNALAVTGSIDAETIRKLRNAKP